LRPGLRSRMVSWCFMFARFTNLLALVTLLVTASLFATKGLNFSASFAGGMIIQVHYPDAIASKSVRDTLARAGFADASVKKIDGYPSYCLIVFPPRDEVLSQSAPLFVQQVIAALRTEQPRVEATHVEIITPKVGGELLLLGPAFLTLACIAIVSYLAIRYGWRVGLSVAVINFRNMVIILGLFLSTYIVFQWEFSLASMSLAILVTGACFAATQS
jgi:preprotein translocase subunit SecF